MTNMTSARIAIVGAGIGGCALATLLQRAGHEVTLYEQAPRFSPVGAGIHLSPNLIRVLRLLGVDKLALLAGHEPAAFVNRRAEDGELLYSLPLGDAANARFGAPFITLTRGDLYAAVMSTVRPASIHWGKRLAGMDWRGETVELGFEDGTVAHADIVIGADGLRSRVREALCGFEKPHFSGQVAFRASYPSHLLEGLPVDDLTKWWGHDTFVLPYWLDRGRSKFYFAAMTPQAEWPTEASSMPVDVDEMYSIFAGYHADVRHMLRQAPPESVSKWALFERSPKFEFGNERVVLIGDACHPMRPFMSQGAAMALEDVAVLYRAISGAPDFASAFSAYDAHRYERLSEVHRVSAANTFMRGPTEPDWVFGYDPLSAGATAQIPAVHLQPPLHARKLASEPA